MQASHHTATEIPRAINSRVLAFRALVSEAARASEEKLFITSGAPILSSFSDSDKPAAISGQFLCISLRFQF